MKGLPGHRLALQGRRLCVRLEMGVVLVVATLACAEQQIDVTVREFTSIRQGFIDTFLDQNPTLATQLGLHEYDEKLADLSAAGVEAGALRFEALLKRLRKIDPSLLGSSDQIDYEILNARLHAELLERREVRTYAMNPMVYPLEVSLGLASLATLPYTSVEERMASATVRLQAVPQLLRSARENLEPPPPLFTRLALQLANAGERFLSSEYSGAFGPVGDLNLRADFETSRAEAASAMRGFAHWLEAELLPRSDGHFAIGVSRFARKLLYEELLDVPLHRLLALGEAELARQQEELVRLAAEFMPGAKPREAIAALSRSHPTPREVLGAAKSWMEQGRLFLEENPILTLPEGPVPEVRQTPTFLRYTFAAMNSAGPFEQGNLDSYYYLTPAEADWPPGRTKAYLSEFNHWVLGIVSLHETYPGHHVQTLAQRKGESLLRRIVPVASYSEGWAHYCEQMMLEEGYGDGDIRLRLVQMKDSLLRLCRLVAAVRLHTLGMSVEEARRLFIEKALVNPLVARQEAERGAYDPMVLVYALGKLQILKLREDLREHQGDRFSLKAFHDLLLSEGEIPLPLLRRRLLPDDPNPSL